MISRKTFFSKEEEATIIEAIKVAEKNTSGEIRVHIEDKCKGNSIERAQAVFNQLKMNETVEQNGILFYLAVKSKDFALIGDKGIHEKVGADFWKTVTDTTIQDFKNNLFAAGLSKSIIACGEQLKKYFPYQSNDKNELPDEISY